MKRASMPSLQIVKAHNPRLVEALRLLQAGEVELKAQTAKLARRLDEHAEGLRAAAELRQGRR